MNKEVGEEIESEGKEADNNRKSFLGDGSQEQNIEEISNKSINWKGFY